MKKFLYSKPILAICRLFFSVFYNKKYLKGKYFDEKRAGWIWAWHGLKGRLFGPNKKIPWPVNRNTIVSHPYNIEFEQDSINVFQSPGCYFQNHDGKIIIGKNVYIAPNVGLITTNHNPYCLDEHVNGKDIIISDSCWIGMNSVVLPGVVLGPHTIVGAGAVVTKSAEDGFCVLGGVPARVVKQLDRARFCTD